MDVAADKLDLYSLPVFLLEFIVLTGLTYSAHYLHFQYKPDPYLSGFYCDDINLRHEYTESKLTEQFNKPDNELVVLSLLMAVPIIVIIFCELVNSMFGSLKFRKIRSMCRCCKLHSITRRTVRFAGAYILGFLLVMISCNVIANTTGHLKPYFAQECPQAFRECPTQTASQSSSVPSLANGNTFGGATASNLAVSDWSSLQPTSERPQPTDAIERSNSSMSFDAAVRPPSQPIISNSNSTAITNPLPAELVRNRRDAMSNQVNRRLVERKWVILTDVNLAELCQFSGDSIQTRRFERLAMSWPSFPASIVSYACLFIACYLCFVGTARPFRLITSILVVLVLLLGLIFNVQLVKEHYNHWEDVLAGSILSFVVVVFVLIVYLNKFRDSHFYENQKLHKQQSYASAMNGSNYNGYSNEIALEQFNADKADERAINNRTGSNQNGDTSGSMPNNDLAMRYFQIPRANYRGSNVVE